ncbi:MAG: tetratricopeptide repeat protein [Nitrospinae bacterium]|nr:tetratricopeptide repeat protein [Nitrospinota bacterium]
MLGAEELRNPSSRLKRDPVATQGGALALAISCLFLVFCIFPSLSWAVDPEALIRDGLMKKARQTGWQGKYEEAAALYRQLIQNNPKDVEALLGLARVLSWQKKYQESAAVYQQVRDMRPDLPDGEIGLLRLQAWQGEHAAAEEGLKALLAKYPKRFDLLLLLGQVTAWQRKFDVSVDYFKKLLELYPDNLEGMQGLARTYKWMRNSKEGIPLYLKILERKPDYLEALLGIGDLYSHEGKYKKAITYLEKARDRAPDRQDIRAMLGTLYSWTARLDDSVTELQKSIALMRGDISGYISLGRVYSWQKKTEESIKLYKQALEINPENTEALVGLGRTHFYNDQWDLAEKHYRKALKIQPNDVEALQAQERLERFQAPTLITRFEFFEFQDRPDPTENFRDIVFRDFRETADYFYKLSAKSRLQLRYQRSDQKQVDKANNLTDFNIGANIGSIGLAQKLPQNIGLRFRFDFNRFENKGNNVFNLSSSETDYAGFFLLTKRLGKHYFTTSFARELFIDTETGNLTVESINTYSASYDVNITEHLSLLLNPSWDDYSNLTGTRDDHVIRARYLLPFYKKIQLEYQLRYLSNPDQSLNSFFINFQHKIKEKFSLEADYVITYNSLDESLEHLTTLFFSWRIAEWISWTVDARYAKETLKDKDITQVYQTYFTLRL